MLAYALASKPCSGATNIDYFLLRILSLTLLVVCGNGRGVLVRIFRYGLQYVFTRVTSFGILHHIGIAVWTLAYHTAYGYAAMRTGSSQ